MNASQLKELEAVIGHVFSDPALLQVALTHSSAGKGPNYERLEFLGDRALGLALAQSLYEKFPGESEGDLAKRLAALAQGSQLAAIARGLDLGRYIDLSEGERAAGGFDKENILADALEALIGALYLDAGLSACRAFVERFWNESFHIAKRPPQHPKTTLQEWAQGEGLPLPEYEIAGQRGPDHAPVFEVRLRVKGYKDTRAQGRTRQEAEKEAAQIFLAALEGKS